MLVDEIINDLEIIKETPSTKKDSALKMHKYHKKIDVDIDDLEGFFSSKVNEMKQLDDSKNIILDTSLADVLPYKIDVPLNDVIVKILEAAHHFVVIVRDDKILYANNSFIEALDAKDRADVFDRNFFKFVVKNDWNVLAKNIGEMLAGNISVNIRINSINNRIIPVQFKAVYIPDNRHFTFLLIGYRFYDKKESHNMLYDSVTGLPNYYLFEDRVQVAVNNEKYNNDDCQNIVSVVGIGIDNIEELSQNGRKNVVLQKLAEKMVFYLDKKYTVASGIKYQFWILMPGIKTESELKKEVKKITGIFSQKISDGESEISLTISVGVSSFPSPAKSAHKLIENAIKGILKAREKEGNDVVLITD